MSDRQITVNGRSYRLVAVDEFTLDEAMIVWEYTKLGLDQIAELEGDHPGLVAALIHIAVARGEPDETYKSIRRIVGQLPVTELATVFAQISEEAEPLPPTNWPADAAGPDATANVSGAVSETRGGPPQASSLQNGSGGRGSATGATSDQVISAP